MKPGQVLHCPGAFLAGFPRFRRGLIPAGCVSRSADSPGRFPGVLSLSCCRRLLIQPRRAFPAVPLSPSPASVPLPFSPPLFSFLPASPRLSLPGCCVSVARAERCPLCLRGYGGRGVPVSVADCLPAVLPVVARSCLRACCLCFPAWVLPCLACFSPSGSADRSRCAVSGDDLRQGFGGIWQAVRGFLVGGAGGLPRYSYYVSKKDFLRSRYALRFKASGAFCSCTGLYFNVSGFPSQIFRGLWALLQMIPAWVLIVSGCLFICSGCPSPVLPVSRSELPGGASASERVRRWFVPGLSLSG